VVLVVAYHAGLPIAGGFTGVDVFFAISGFVITTTLVRELAAHDRIDLRRFYARRIKRLLPGLATMLTAVALLGTVASPEASQRIGAQTGIFSALFGANFYLYHLSTAYFDVSATLNPLLHTWTLAVEEQFYLVFPGLLLVSWRLGRRRVRAHWAAFIVIAVVSLASFALAVKAAGGVIGGETSTEMFTAMQRFAFYGSPTRAWEFGAGALLALVAVRLARLPALVAHAAAAAGCAMIIVGAVVLRSTSHVPGTSMLLPVLGAGALLAAGTATQRGIPLLLSIRPAVWIGDISYSWYLWHWPLIVFAKALFPTAILWPDGNGVAVIAAGASLLPAWLSYRYVENRIRFDPRISGRALAIAAVVCLVVPIGACVGLLGASRALYGRTVTTLQQSQERYGAETRGCMGGWTAGAAVRCTWGVRAPRGRVVLVGDSNAAQFTGPVVAAAGQAGFDATIVALAGCPFTEARQSGSGNAPEELCRSYVAETEHRLATSRPSLVIVASRTDLYIDRDDVGVGGPTGPLSYVTLTKARYFEQGLASAIGRLNHAGIPVLVVHTIPRVPTPTGACAVIRLLTHSCGSSVERRTAEHQRELVFTIEKQAVSSSANASTIDFADFACGPNRCSSLRGDEYIFRDALHLSNRGALLLAPRFYRAILSRAR
jgi:peptidoglycan/LPS O-acetylase OafA/YrhL